MNIDELLLAWSYQKKYQTYLPKMENFLTDLYKLRNGDVPHFIKTKEFILQRDEFQKLMEKNICFTYPSDQNYPTSFLRINEPPFLLSFLGNPIWKDPRCLAVVGSREVSSYSISWMEENLNPLVKSEIFYLASGGARGVDQKAHEICIKNNRPTVAFLPSGFDRIYPYNLKDWIKPIIENGGALVTEYDYQQQMKKHFFQARNRLIAGMGVCTLIVQAARRSGSLITARQCLEHGKNVLAVPGHPSDPCALGNLDLIYEGAVLVRDKVDVLSYWRSEFSSISRTAPALRHYI